MKAIAAKLKVKAEKVDKAAKEAILKGYLKTAEVIASIKDFYQQEVRSKRCEDFVSSTVSIPFHFILTDYNFIGSNSLIFRKLLGSLEMKK